MNYKTHESQIGELSWKAKHTDQEDGNTNVTRHFGERGRLTFKHGDQKIEEGFKLFPGQRARFEDDLITAYIERNRDLDEEFKVEVEPGDSPEDHWGWTRLIPQGAKEFTRRIWLQLLEANQSLNVLDTEERVAEAWFRRFMIVDVIAAMAGYQQIVFPSLQYIEDDFIALTPDGRLLIGTEGVQGIGIDYITHPFLEERQFRVLSEPKSTLEQENENVVAVYLAPEKINPGIFEVAQAMSDGILEETERALHPERFLR